MSETSRLHIPELSSSEKVSEGPAKINSGFGRIDEINWGQQDYLQAGVVESSDWSFTATINGSSGVLGSEAATGGKAWLPDPSEAARLMRSVTASATLSGLTPSTLPTSGKYMCIGFELAPSYWGSSATVTVKSGTEKGSQAEAEAASPAVSSGKIRVRDVIVKNTSGVYSIVEQVDRRVYALNGTALATESVTGSKLGEGTIRQETGTAQGFLSWGNLDENGKIQASSGDFTAHFSGEDVHTITWKTEKASESYAVLATPEYGGEVGAGCIIEGKSKSGFVIRTYKGEKYVGIGVSFIAIALS